MLKPPLSSSCSLWDVPCLLLLLRELGSRRANNQDIPTSISGGTLPDPIDLSPNKSVTAFPRGVLSPAWPRDLWDQNQFAIQRAREVPKGGKAVTRSSWSRYGLSSAHMLHPQTLASRAAHQCRPDLGASLDMTTELSSKSKDHLGKLCWACQQETITAGLLDHIKKGRGKVMEPSPEYPATPPNQLL